FTASNFWTEFQEYYKSTIVDVARVASVKRLAFNKGSSVDAINVISIQPERFVKFFSQLVEIAPTIQIFEHKYFRNDRNQFDSLLATLTTSHIAPSTEIIDTKFRIILRAKEKDNK
ncbi:hypothetical protein PMAYCL1PPCAC_17149, partial [Pristionchus mayeri]